MRYGVLLLRFQLYLCVLWPSLFVFGRRLSSVVAIDAICGLAACVQTAGDVDEVDQFVSLGVISEGVGNLDCFIEQLVEADATHVAAISQHLGEGRCGS